MSSDTEPRKVPYPRGVLLILLSTFCEQYSYNGMRSILVLFSSNVILLSSTNSSVLFHGFTFLLYFNSILGAILADSFIGKYKQFWNNFDQSLYSGKYRTMLYMSLVYVLGHVVIVISSAGFATKPTEILWVCFDFKISVNNSSFSVVMLIGLFLVGIGTGSYNACVAPFGGDQFILPDQKKHSEAFFSIFYWFAILGGLVSLVIIPQIRSG